MRPMHVSALADDVGCRVRNGALLWIQLVEQSPAADHNLVNVRQDGKWQLAPLTQRQSRLHFLRRNRPQVRSERQYLVIYFGQLDQLTLTPWSPITPIEQQNERTSL